MLFLFLLYDNKKVFPSEPKEKEKETRNKSSNSRTRITKKKKFQVIEDPISHQKGPINKKPKQLKMPLKQFRGKSLSKGNKLKRK